MDDVNVYGDVWTDGTDEPGFRNRKRRLAATLGAEKLGASAGFARTDGARSRLLNRDAANLDYFDGER